MAKKKCINSIPAQSVVNVNIVINNLQPAHNEYGHYRDAITAAIPVIWTLIGIGGIQNNPYAIICGTTISISFILMILNLHDRNKRNL